jgi:NADH:ubiquinone oxidoreductase subunit K
MNLHVHSDVPRAHIVFLTNLLFEIQQLFLQHRWFIVEILIGFELVYYFSSYIKVMLIIHKYRKLSKLIESFIQMVILFSTYTSKSFYIILSSYSTTTTTTTTTPPPPI